MLNTFAEIGVPGAFLRVLQLPGFGWAQTPSNRLVKGDGSCVILLAGSRVGPRSHLVEACLFLASSLSKRALSFLTCVKTDKSPPRTLPPYDFNNSARLTRAGRIRSGFTTAGRWKSSKPTSIPDSAENLARSSIRCRTSSSCALSTASGRRSPHGGIAEYNLEMPPTVCTPSESMSSINVGDRASRFSLPPRLTRLCEIGRHPHRRSRYRERTTVAGWGGHQKGARSDHPLVPEPPGSQRQSPNMCAFRDHLSHPNMFIAYTCVVDQDVACTADTPA